MKRIISTTVLCAGVLAATAPAARAYPAALAVANDADDRADDLYDEGREAIEDGRFAAYRADALARIAAGAPEEASWAP